MPSKVDLLKKRIDEQEAAFEKMQADRGKKVQEVKRKRAAAEEDIPMTEGRLGLVSPESRQANRKTMAKRGTVQQFVEESSLSVAGSAIGGLMGAHPAASVPTGGWSIPAGAAAGGFIGETIAQETGMAEESDVALALSTLPVVGPVTGKVAQKVGRGLWTSLRTLPGVRTAVTRMTQERAAKEFESVGTQIYGNRVGMIAADSDVMYAASKSFSGADIPIENFQRTFKNIRHLVDIYSDYPGMEAAAIKTEKALRKVLSSDTKSLGMQDVMKVYKATNDLAIAAERTPGVTSKIADDVFKMFDKDISMIAEGGSKAGRAAAIVQGAFKKSKLDRAVQTLERGMSKFMKVSDDGDDMLGVVEFRKWLGNKTNPKSSEYDKMLSEELAPDLPRIKKSLDLLSKTAQDSTNPGGPGSLAFRATGASLFGAAGYQVAGPVGAVIGGIRGTRLPEDIVAILLSPMGRASLDFMARRGHGTINPQHWTTLMAIAQNAANRPAQGFADYITSNMQQQPGP